MQAEKLREAGQPIVEQARTVGEEVGRLGRVTREQARDGLDLVKDSAREMVDSGMSQAEQIEQNVESAIRSKPFRTTAFAAIAGVAVGVVIGAKFTR